MRDKDIAKRNLMVEYCEEIMMFTQDVSDIEDLENDAKTKAATLMNIMLIGEVAKNVSDDFIEKYNCIDWKSIKGFRNVIAHQYEDVSLEILFNVIKLNIPELLRELKK